MQTGPEGVPVEMNSAARRRRHAALGYGRIVTWLVSGVVLIAFVSYVALPFGLTLYIPRLAAQYGIPLDVDRVRVEPFRSTLRLSGVRLATAGHSTMEWSSAEARVDLARLLSGRLVLDGFRLSEARLHEGDAGASGRGTLADILPAPLPEEITVGELVIDNVELATLSRTLGRAITVDWLRISSLEDLFRPDGAEVHLDASIGEGRSRVQGRLVLDSTSWSLDAGVRASDIPLDGLPALFGVDGASRGRLDGSGPIRLVYSPVDGAFSTTTGGRWAIEGPELTLAGTAVSGARIDWDGAAFITVSQQTVETLSVEATIGLHELDVDVVDLLDLEAAELGLRVDASRTPVHRLVVEGASPAVRIRGRSGAFEGIGLEAANLTTGAALTLTDDLGIEIDRLAADTLIAALPTGGSIDLERLKIDRIVVPRNADAAAAAATAERVEWRGLTEPRSSGTATGVAVQGLERHGNGVLRFASASAATAEERNGESDLRLRDIEIDTTTLSPTGAMAFAGARVADTWLVNDASTLVLEQLSLDGIERNESGRLSIASGTAGVVDHTQAGRQTSVGSGVEVAGVAVSGRAWAAEHARLSRVDVETGIATYTLRELALIDARSDGERIDARLVRFDELEHGFVGNRIVVEGLYAAAPTWRAGVGAAEAIEAASLTVDTADRHRWQSNGWRLTDVETAASRAASAATASVKNLALNLGADLKAGAEGIELDGLSFDGTSMLRATNAAAARAHFGTSDGTAVDINGASTGALEWNGETLALERGSAPWLSVAAATARASFDTIEFGSVRLGAGVVQQIETLQCVSGRGRTDPVGEWSTGRLAIGGYHAVRSGGTTLDSVDALDVEVGETNGAHLLADRVLVREVQVEPSGTAVLARAEVGGMTLRDPRGQEPVSARTLQASQVTIRGSAADIGSLALFGAEGTIGVSEQGHWEIPAVPLGVGGGTPSSIRLRIRDARTGDSASILRIVDRTTEPDFTATLAIEDAALRGFDSEATGSPAEFSVAASGDVFGTLQVSGSLTPTLTGTDLDLDMTIQGLSLSGLSPYTRTHLGQGVEGGHAKVALDFAVRTSDLEGTAVFASNEIVLAEPASAAGSPGLGPALSRLQDERGGIELKVPLRGKLDAPGFDFDAFLIHALADTVLRTAGASTEAQ